MLSIENPNKGSEGIVFAIMWKITAPSPVLNHVTSSIDITAMKKTKANMSDAPIPFAVK